jgi:peptidoglycan/xylan/chitin deacetylase (PgdA/CDA1 family)
MINKLLLSIAAQEDAAMLMYHSVSNEHPAWEWCVGMDAFSDQLGLLRKYGWRTILMRELRSLDALPPKTLVITFDDGYADNYDAFKVLLSHGFNATFFVIAGAVGKTNEAWKTDDAPACRMLSKEQIKEMADAGMEIGSHTITHQRLAGMKRPLRVKELRESQEILEHITDKPVESFCYPYGIYSARTPGELESFGYRLACCTDCGRISESADLMQIKRLIIFGSDSLSRFAMKLACCCNAPTIPSWLYCLRALRIKK